MQEEIHKCIEVLLDGGLIVYPTDTLWGIGCDATNEAAVAKVFALKKRDLSKKMSCLVAHEFMLEKHVKQVPEVAYDLIDLATKPTTIVYDQPVGMAQNLVSPNQTIAIRVASDKFCQYLIAKFKRPLVATSANLSGAPAPRNFKEISAAILKGVDYVVNLPEEKKLATPSSIIQLKNDGTVKIIRE
tara:strand:- start:49160 stop:49720 length:561 start_codon:yes stop_codon:yes gene_type:complete